MALLVLPVVVHAEDLLKKHYTDEELIDIHQSQQKRPAPQGAGPCDELNCQLSVERYLDLLARIDFIRIRYELFVGVMDSGV